MTPQYLGDSDASSTDASSGTVERAADRRRNTRRAHRLSVKLLSRTGDAISYMGLTENLSADGVFVATRAPWDIGSAVDVIIGLPQQKIVHARGRLCWRRSEASDGSTAPGVGIQFERVSSEDANRIRDFAQA